MSETLPRIDVAESFCIGANWQFYYDDLKKKVIGFAFKPSEIERDHWTRFGFEKAKHLLTFLKKEYDGLDNFEVIFFNHSLPEPFYLAKKGQKTVVYVHLDTYRSYGAEINPLIEELRINKYARKIWIEYSKKVPIAFFNKDPPSKLSDELKASYYRIIEYMIREYENLEESERKALREIFEHSKLGTEAIKKHLQLNPEAPERQLKLFLEVIDKLGEREVEELLSAILKSRIQGLFIKRIVKMSIKDQNRIARKMPEMAKMYDRYEKLKKSLREFKKKIEEHQVSSNKDEKDIHKFLTANYWLLGIEYFDKIESELNFDGHETSRTRIGRKSADFIVKRLNGIDKCVIIELEEANDRVFNDDGTLSKKVYDGINQAVDYYIEQKVRGIDSRGIAIVGSVSASELKEEQKMRFRLLAEAFHNVEVLTYDQIITKAETTLNFWNEYEKQESFIEHS